MRRSEDGGPGRSRQSHAKSEGVATKPMPIVQRAQRDVALGRVRLASAGEPRCEMCGAAVIASHCERICPKCGFMTGCSEGI